MQQTHSEKIQIHGAGFADSTIPKWILFIRHFGTLLLFSLICVFELKMIGWGSIIEFLFERTTGQTSTSSLLVLTGIILLNFVVSYFLLKSKLFYPTLGLRLNTQKKLVFGGFKTNLTPSLLFSISGGISILAFTLIVSEVKNFPLATQIQTIHRNAAAPTSKEGLLPIYFWDYATWFDSKWIEKYDIVLPYEKGPPEKLLPKVYFKNIQTGEIEIELHGKRPRSYTKETTLELLNRLSHLPKGSSLYYPSTWATLYWIQKETGQSGKNVLSLVELNQGTDKITHAIGSPWFQLGADTNENLTHSQAFFWGPDGSVFQVKCKAPCALERFFDLVQFPNDPRGSLAERKEWTANTIRELLSQMPMGGRNDQALIHARANRERLLNLYLISLITMDPRDPEAFFHIGKLAQNKETVQAAIAYGRDLKLEPAKIAELEARK